MTGERWRVVNGEEEDENQAREVKCRNEEVKMIYRKRKAGSENDL